MWPFWENLQSETFVSPFHFFGTLLAQSKHNAVIQEQFPAAIEVSNSTGSLKPELHFHENHHDLKVAVKHKRCGKSELQKHVFKRILYFWFGFFGVKSQLNYKWAKQGFKSSSFFSLFWPQTRSEKMSTFLVCISVG